MISLKDKNVLLVNAFDDEIEQEGNGKYQLSFKYPTSDQRWKNIDLADLLLADDLHGEQEFRVFEIIKRNGYIFVYANQVVDDLNSYSISNISVDRVDGQTVMQALAGSIIRKHPFAFYSDIQSKHTFNQKNTSVMDALAKGKHSIIGQWGGDLVRDKYHVNLLRQGGRNSEALFMYKKNLKSYAETNSIKGLFTRLNLSVKDSDITTTVDSPLIGSYGGRIYELNIEVMDQDVTTLEQLQEYGRNYFAEKLVDIPNNSLTISVTDNQEYDIRMFDTVFVHHEIFDKDLRMKITSYRFSPMGRKLKSIGFGKIRTSLNQQVSNIATEVAEQSVSVAGQVFEEKLQKEIENADKVIDGKIDKAKSEINDGIEQSKAEAEEYADNIRQNIESQIAEADRLYQEAQRVQDRQIADVLAKANATAILSERNRADLEQTRASLTTKTGQLEQSVDILRSDVMSQAQSLLAQARAQADLTSRVATVETTANGTKETLTELSKTLNKATGDIASVTSRTKTVEDNLSQTRTQYEALTQTVNGYTGQIDGISRRTGTIEAGLTGVTERFEKLRFNNRNYFRGYQLNEEIAVRNFGSGGFLQLYDKITADLVGTVGETYTVSFEVISPTNGDATVRAYNSNGYPSYFSFVKPFSDPVGSVWKKYSYTFTNQHNPNGSATTNYNRLEFYFNRNGCRLRNIKIEKGSFATDWCPADEDVNAEIASYKRTAEESSAELQRQIQTVDGKAVDAKNYAQQTADSIRTQLESLETYKNAEGARASQYFSASRDETARQLSALRTAITDGYVAKSVYEEDARGITQRFEELSSATDVKIAEYKTAVDGRFATLQSQKANQIDLQTVRETVDLYERIIGSTEVGIKDKVARMVMSDSLFLSEVRDRINGTATQVNQLSNSWAVRNLTSAGTVLNQINLLADGTNRIDGRLTHITGQTLIDNAVITSAMVSGLDAGKITAGYISGNRFQANSITGDKLVMDSAFFNKFTANEVYLKQLFAKNAFITSVQTVTMSASKIVGGLLRATNGAVAFDLNRAKMTFNSSATIEFNSSGNALVRKVGDVTGFLHFNNATAGGTYVGLGVTSHNEGVKSQNTSRFAGVRIFRSNDNVDQTEIYGDKILLGHAFNGPAFTFTPTKLDKSYEMVDIVNSLKALWRCWLHWNNTSWNPDDMNMRRAVINEYNTHNIG